MSGGKSIVMKMGGIRKEKGHLAAPFESFKETQERWKGVATSKCQENCQGNSISTS